MSNKIVLGHLMSILTMLIWGTTYISTKVLLTALSPIEILFVRFAIAYLILIIIHPKFYQFGPLKEEALFAAAGFTGITMYYLVENIALQYTLASNVGLLITTAPILTAMLAHWFTHDEKLNQNLIVGFIIAMTGVFLVIFNGNYVLRLNPLGDLLALSASVFWAAYSVLLKKLGNKYNYIYITRKIFLYGIIMMIPALFIFGFNLNGAKLSKWSVLSNLLFLSLLASALCFVMWNTAVNFIGVVKTSNYIYLVPLITITTAVIILKEKITLLAMLGTVLILLGVYISEHHLPKLNFHKLTKSN